MSPLQLQLRPPVNKDGRYCLVFDTNRTSDLLCHQGVCRDTLEHMDSQKLDSGIFIRLHSETLDRLKKKAKEHRRRLAEYLRLALEDLSNAEK